MSYAFLDCRDLGHAWVWTTDEVVQTRAGRVSEYARELHCARCHTTRSDRFTVRRHAVEKTRRRYRYPEGYAVPGGMTANDARVLMFEKRQRGA